MTRQHEQEAAGRIWRGGDENCPRFRTGGQLRFALGFVREEAEGPHAFAWEFHQDDLAEQIAVLTAEGGDDLFDRVVNRPDTRNFLQRPFPEAEEKFAEEIM